MPAKKERTEKQKRKVKMDEDTEQLQQRQQYLPHNKKKQQQIVSELFQYDLQRGKIKDIIAYYYEGNGSVSGNWLKQIEL